MKRQSPQLSEKEWPELRGIKAAKIINPKIRSYFAKLMTEGDPYCELVFEETEG